jgi:Tol biopolymer transport system component
MPQRVLVDARYLRVMGPNHLMFARGPSVWVAPFDMEGGRLTGPEVLLAQDVAAFTGGVSSGLHLGAARDGSMFYLPAATARGRNTVVWLDSGGQASPPLDGLPAGEYQQVRVSPDGSRLALGTSRTDHVWIYSVLNRPFTRLLPDTRDDRYPLWSTDGQRVLFTANVDERPTIFAVPVDGGPAEPLFTSAPGATDVRAEGWTPDGQTLLLYEGRNGQVDIGTLGDGGKGPAQMQVRPQSNEAAPRVSPDGHLIAYHSNMSGAFEVYVERFPEFTQRTQVSSGGGRNPVWSADGRRLYFVRPDGQAVLAADIAAMARDIAVAGRTTVATGSFLPSGGAQRILDLAPDGRLLVLKSLPRTGADSRAGQVVFLENFLDRLGPATAANSATGDSPR